MARKNDLEKVQSDIQAVVQEMQGVQAKYTTYATQVSETIVKILTDAGVYDQVHALETERQEEAKKANEQHTRLQEKIRDLEKVRDYLTNLEKAEEQEKAPALEVVPPISEEIPALEVVPPIPEETPEPIPEETPEPIPEETPEPIPEA